LAVVAGIDEAGLGPVLGPLVVSATAISLPDELAEVSLWRLLAPAVRKRPSRRTSGIVIADSKKLYTRQSKRPLHLLERGVLAMMQPEGEPPRTLSELLRWVASDAPEKANGYSWYAGAEVSLPVSMTSTELLLAGKEVEAALRRLGIPFPTLRAEVVFAGEFNRLVSATRNKSTTLFDITSRLLRRLWRQAGSQRLRVYVDQHGGRIRYRPALQRVFAECELRILEEARGLSAYALADGKRQAEILFLRNGEERQLPVALASMMGKYIRELFMILLNRYWTGIVPDLRPTAGYYVDGRRFFDQIKSAAQERGVERRLIYRSR